MRDSPVYFRYADNAGVWHDVQPLKRASTTAVPSRLGRNAPRRRGTLLTRSDPIRLFLPRHAPVAPTAPTDVPLAEGHRDFSAGQKGLPTRHSFCLICAAHPRLGYRSYIRMPHRGATSGLSSVSSPQLRTMPTRSTSKSSRPRSRRLSSSNASCSCSRPLRTRLMPSASGLSVRLDDESMTAASRPTMAGA